MHHVSSYKNYTLLLHIKDKSVEVKKGTVITASNAVKEFIPDLYRKKEFSMFKVIEYKRKF